MLKSTFSFLHANFIESWLFHNSGKIKYVKVLVACSHIWRKTIDRKRVNICPFGHGRNRHQGKNISFNLDKYSHLFHDSFLSYLTVGYEYFCNGHFTQSKKYSSFNKIAMKNWKFAFQNKRVAKYHWKVHKHNYNHMNYQIL